METRGNTLKAPPKARGRKLGRHPCVPDGGEEDATTATPKLETEFEESLEHVFGWSDDDPMHEVKESPIHVSVTKWARFIGMSDSDIQSLTDVARGESRVLIGPFPRNQPSISREMVREKLKAGNKNAGGISSHLHKDIIKCEFKHSEIKRKADKKVSSGGKFHVGKIGFVDHICSILKSSSM